MELFRLQRFDGSALEYSIRAQVPTLSFTFFSVSMSSTFTCLDVSSFSEFLF